MMLWTLRMSDDDDDGGGGGGGDGDKHGCSSSKIFTMYAVPSPPCSSSSTYK